MRGKSAPGHYFSGVECNFRVFQGIFPGERKSRVFQSLPGIPGCVRHPVHTSHFYRCSSSKSATGYLLHSVFSAGRFVSDLHLQAQNNFNEAWKSVRASSRARTVDLPQGRHAL